MTWPNGLNPEQIKAVTTVHGPVFVLAGPGSGKTRVLTRRIAYLIDEAGMAPWHILAVTFTNKAAAEMRERVEKIFEEKFGPPPPGQPPRLGGLTIGTFHSLCARILRVETALIGFQPNWVIYDSSDQLALVRGILSELNLDEKRFAPKAIHAHISKLKNELVTPRNLPQRQLLRGDCRPRLPALPGSAPGQQRHGLRRSAAAHRLLLRDNIELRVKYQHKWRFCWWTNFRTPTPPSMSWCGCWLAHRATIATFLWSATTISRSTASVARTITMCERFKRDFPERPKRCWSKTTAAPRRFWT